MDSDRFTVLRAEFETLSKRLGETEDLTERQVALEEVRQVLDEMDALIRSQQATLQKKLDKTRDGC